MGGDLGKQFFYADAVDIYRLYETIFVGEDALGDIKPFLDVGD